MVQISTLFRRSGCLAYALKRRLEVGGTTFPKLETNLLNTFHRSTNDLIAVTVVAVLKYWTASALSLATSNFNSDDVS